VYCGDHVLLTRTATGRRIYLDMRDAAVAPIIALGDDYEPEVAAVLSRLAAPGQIVFDVGANVGHHSLLLYDRVRGSDSQVHLFEPNPTIHRILQRTFHTNGFWQGVRINRLALSDQLGSASLTVYEDLWGGARLPGAEGSSGDRNRWYEATTVRETFDVPLTTVDHYCDEHGIDHIDLMKIDVEGHEEAVFAGITKTLEASRSLSVVMEFTFGAYANDGAFWHRLCASFPHRFAIGPRGSLTAVSTLDDLRQTTQTELVNVLLSKRPVAG
jgi:FkbM family methyltransferase